jgi:hypothetical protein
MSASIPGAIIVRIEENKLGRIINIDSAGKSRSQLSKAIVLALKELAGSQKPIDKRLDLAAFISLSLIAIAETVEQSVAAWEKRGYWVKADRFRMEWHWTHQAAHDLKEALNARDWDRIDQLASQIARKLSKVQVATHHRMGQPWVGAWEKLKSDVIS